MDLGIFKQKSFFAPFAAWLLFCSCYLFLFSLNDQFPSVQRMLTQWDGQHYLSIASGGYEMFPCPGMPENICGNVGWFPLYPIVTAVVSMVGIDARLAILLVSWLSLLGALLVMYRLAVRRAGETAAMWTLVALLSNPAAFYFLTAFPYSLLLLLVTVAFDMMDRGAFRYLWIPVGAAAVTYPSGIVLMLPVVALLISNWKSLSNRGKIHLGAALVAPMAAIGVYFLYYWWKFDSFLLYVIFQGQSYYAHELAFPLITIYHSFTTLPLSEPAVIALLYSFGAGLLFHSRRLPLTWLLWMWGVLLFTPTMGTTQCYYRHVVIAFPLAVLIGLSAANGKRRIAAWGCIAVGCVLMWVVFLKNYASGQLM